MKAFASRIHLENGGGSRGVIQPSHTSYKLSTLDGIIFKLGGAVIALLLCEPGGITCIEAASVFHTSKAVLGANRGEERFRGAPPKGPPARRTPLLRSVRPVPVREGPR